MLVCYLVMWKYMRKITTDTKIQKINMNLHKTVNVLIRLVERVVMWRLYIAYSMWLYSTVNPHIDAIPSKKLSMKTKCQIMIEAPSLSHSPPLSRITINIILGYGPTKVHIRLLFRLCWSTSTTSLLGWFSIISLATHEEDNNSKIVCEWFLWSMQNNDVYLYDVNRNAFFLSQSSMSREADYQLENGRSTTGCLTVQSAIQLYPLTRIINEITSCAFVYEERVQLWVFLCQQGAPGDVYVCVREARLEACVFLHKRTSLDICTCIYFTTSLLQQVLMHVC